MGGNFRQQLRYLWLYFILLFCWTMSPAQQNCDNERQHATDSGAPSLSLPRSTSRYHMLRIQSDPILGKKWAMMVNSDHPEWPAFALPLQGCEKVNASQQPQQTSSSNIQAPPMVHAGDIVRVWRQERFLRLEVAAISEENGRLGQRIQVRLSQIDPQSSASPEQISGLVRGPSSVELQP
jgi:hypothetical protein